MSAIGFIGLGNMGSHMAANLVKAGHEVKGFDVVTSNVDAFVSAGGVAASSISEASSSVDMVVTMLPAGKHVREVYTSAEGILASANPGTLLIDSSTIDVTSARAVAEAAQKSGMQMIDAPVSGGVGGAEAGTLTFMVGGGDETFEQARPVLEAMGKNIFHAGGAGNGQAAKICNNMILGISMIGVCEAFVLAEQLGLDHQKLFDISSTASGQCWSLTTYCPVPGPIPTTPANNGYKPGFSVGMMLKDLKLAQDAAQASNAATPLGAQAAAVYALFEAAGHADTDFSGIIKLLRGNA
ncbi:MAG: 3-hydroxyisobutyrate dehydrogenase [Alphaproteobacteria bacterium]|nr:3-hydroxyisobutyrate dehydrogenase [Alphaproteobacteria bacterium]